MALDQRRLPDDRNRFDHVGVQRALSQEINLPQLRRFDLEHFDERGADDLAFLFRIDDAREPLEKQRGRVHEHERQAQTLVALADLRRLVEAKHAVVDEDAGQLAADGAMDQQRRNGGVDATAQRAHDAALTDLRTDARRRLIDERRHRPVAGAAADAVREVAEDLETPLGVHDFGMEQDRVETS